MSETSIAHRHDMNHIGRQEWPDGNVPWSPAQAPDLARNDSLHTTGRLRGCGYCGSMHPADVAAAIRAGAVGHWADRKYGWPHKAYFSGVPNPHAGMLESRCGASNPPQEEIDAGAWVRCQIGFNPVDGTPMMSWRDAGAPAPSTLSHAKFYSIHLQDATPEDRATIEQHLRLAFDFTDDGGVRWRPVIEDGAAAAP